MPPIHTGHSLQEARCGFFDGITPTALGQTHCTRSLCVLVHSPKHAYRECFSNIFYPKSLDNCGACCRFEHTCGVAESEEPAELEDEVDASQRLEEEEFEEEVRLKEVELEDGLVPNRSEGKELEEEVAPNRLEKDDLEEELKPNVPEGEELEEEDASNRLDDDKLSEVAPKRLAAKRPELTKSDPEAFEPEELELDEEVA